MTWLHAGGDWRCWLDQADFSFATLAAAISRFENIIIGCRDHQNSRHVHKLNDSGQPLGVTRFLWLRHGRLIGDDTDSHIDTLARFCDPRAIAYQGRADASDPHFEPLQAMAEELRALRAADGEPYRLIELPLPAARYDEEGKRLPAIYAHFLLVNGAVLDPTYNDPQNAVALARLKSCFPDREVLGVPYATLIRQYGSLRCATMQLPAGVLGMAAESMHRLECGRA